MFVESLANWTQNLKRLVFGRPSWSASSEFAYYTVDERLVREHRDRQIAFERGAYAEALRLVRTFDLLDTHELAGKRVLDLGAGECLLAAGLVTCGAAEVWAVDAVPKQIWAAAAHHKGKTMLHFAIADARDLPFSDGAFDMCTANLLLHHIEPLGPLLQEIHRVLKPGGRFIAVEPSPIVGMLVHEKTSENEAPVSPRSVREALEKAGFESVKSENYWSRLETSRLGAMSPAYRMSARKPGTPCDDTPVSLRRRLVEMRLKGLQIDEGCEFSDLAHQQEEQILRILGQS